MVDVSDAEMTYRLLDDPDQTYEAASPRQAALRATEDRIEASGPLPSGQPARQYEDADTGLIALQREDSDQVELYEGWKWTEQAPDDPDVPDWMDHPDTETFVNVARLDRVHEDTYERILEDAGDHP